MAALIIVPGILLAWLFDSAVWLLTVPLGLLLLWIALAVWGPKRNVTPQQLAEELERHLLGTGGAWDWDDTTSIAIADQRLDRLRAKLHKFDTFALPEWENEFREIIAALRRGEIPDVKDD